MSEKNEINRASKIALIMSGIAIFGMIILTIGAYYFYEESYTVLRDQYVGLRQQIISIVRSKQPAPLLVPKELFQNFERELSELRKEVAKNTNNHAKILSEVNYLVLIANEKLQFLCDISGAIETLNVAQHRLSMIPESDFSNLRAAINKDLIALSETPVFNQQGLWEEVGSLSSVIDKLKLKQLGVEEQAPVSKSLTLSSWKTAVYSAWSEFKSLIRISRIEENPIPLTGLVQEQFQLKREIYTLVAQAQWAVLQKNQKIYTSSLSSIEKLLKAYFVENIESTELIARLNALQTKNLPGACPSLAGTLQALSQTSLVMKE